MANNTTSTPETEAQPEGKKSSTVYFDPGTHDLLKAYALKERRSVSAQVEIFVEQALGINQEQ